MRQLLAVLLFCAGIFCLAQTQAQVPMTGAGLGAPGGGGGGACAAYTAYKAQMDGTFNSTYQSAAQTFICGLNTDGVLAKMDVGYLWANSSAANAKVNFAGASFNGTSHGTVSFSAGNGFTGDGSTFYIDTSFNPNTAGGQFALNSAHVMVCDLTVSLDLTNDGVVGQFDGNFSELVLSNGGILASSAFINSAAASRLAFTYSAGSIVAQRTGSTANELDVNGSQVATSSDVSTALVNNNVFFFARNNFGAADINSDDQLAAGSIGSALSPTDLTNYHNLLNAYMTAIGGSGC